MLKYRVYVLDSVGDVTAVRQLAADADADALAAAQRQWPNADIWQGTRPVGFLRSGKFFARAPEE